MVYLTRLKFLRPMVAIPYLLVFLRYFLPLNLKVMYLYFKMLPLELTNLAVNLIVLAFFLERF